MQCPTGVPSSDWHPRKVYVTAQHVADFPLHLHGTCSGLLVALQSGVHVWSMLRRAFLLPLASETLPSPPHLCLQRVGQRAMILSGMNAAEVGEIIGAYRDAGETPHAAIWGVCHDEPTLALHMYSGRHAASPLLLIQVNQQHSTSWTVKRELWAVRMYMACAN